MYLNDITVGMRVDIPAAITPRNPYNGIIAITIEACNQHGEVVLTNVTEAIVKYRQ